MNDVENISFRKRIALELIRRKHKNDIEMHTLRQLFWECTLRCNLHCRHCGSDCKTSTLHPDMPKDDFMHVLDTVATKTDPHKVFVIITGGEPLMRLDIEQCGREIYEKGFPWGMVTNGLFLTPKRFEGLINSGIHTMTVSLDGLEANHTWMRGNAKSFSMVSNALDMMRESPLLAYDVVTCVTDHNFDELPAIHDFLIDKGLKRWRLFSVFPVGRAANDPNMRLTPEHFRGIMEFIKKTRKEGNIMASYGCEGFLGNYESEVRNGFFFCHAGISVGSVLVDGSISACASIRPDYHQGNIYKDDFMDVWENKFQKYRDHSWMHTDDCASCRFWRYCQGNGMHLRDAEGKLLFCQLKKLKTES